MNSHIPYTRAAALLSTGALGIAATTAFEVVTAPYGPAVMFYAANGAVHALKVVAVLCFALGAVAAGVRLAPRLGRIGRLALPTLALATVLAALPYSVVEALLDTGLTPAEATTQLDSVYEQHAWIGTLASAALPLMLFGVIVLGVSVLRRRALPAWAPWLSLAAIPVAVGAGIVGESGSVPLPHPPTWVFLGLAAYGVAMRRSHRAHTRLPSDDEQLAGDRPSALSDR